MKVAGAVADGLNKEAALAERNLAVLAGLPDRAAEWQTRVDRVRTNRAVLIWGVASFLAMVVSGAFGILLLMGRPQGRPRVRGRSRHRAGGGLRNEAAA